MALLDNKGMRTELVDNRDTIPAVMLMYAKEMRLDIHGPDIFPASGETDTAFRIRQRASWGLVEHTMAICKQFKVDKLLVEAKANGITVGQEIKRLNRTNDWSVELINPGNLDKVARAYAVQAVFSNGQV